MPLTQDVLDNWRDRRLRLRCARGRSETAALVTLAAIAAGAAGLTTTALEGHDLTADRLIATVTKLTVAPGSGPGSVDTLAASSRPATPKSALRFASTLLASQPQPPQSWE